MKKSVSIMATLLLVGTVATATALPAEEEPSKPAATERQTTHVSRDSERPPLGVDGIVEAKKAMWKAHAEKRKEEIIAAEKKRAEARAARAAAREAERRAAEKRAEEARQRKAERAENQSSTPEPKTYSKPSGNIKQYAAGLVGAGQFGCLDSLWIRESNWNHLAQNPSSGAYGIPQALPGSKMASAGSDWRTNPYTQVRWGVNYIKSRYGTPCSAWAHSESVGWY